MTEGAGKEGATGMTPRPANQGNSSGRTLRSPFSPKVTDREDGKGGESGLNTPITPVPDSGIGFERTGGDVIVKVNPAPMAMTRAQTHQPPASSSFRNSNLPRFDAHISEGVDNKGGDEEDEQNGDQQESLSYK